jgi:membrane fusion protein, multidrug efflux system
MLMNRSIKLSLGLTCLFVVWMGFGPLIKGNGASKLSIKKAHKRMKVVSVVSKAQEIERNLIVNGHTKPSKEAILKAEMIVVVEKVLRREGKYVKKGDVLVQFQLSDRLSRLKEAQAKVFDETQTLKAMNTLHPQGFSAKTKYYETQAELAKANAVLHRIKIEIAKTKIVAPFDGIISDITVEEGDYLKAGDKVGVIVNNTPLEVEIGVAQSDINRLVLGAKAQVNFLSGKQEQGVVKYIAPQANEITRMFQVKIEAPNLTNMRSGMSTQVIIATKKILAHFISPALLSINMEGVIGVKVLDKQSVVHFMPVNIIQSDTKGIWISGLAPFVDLISVGQGFVEDGETVDAITSGEHREQTH